MAEIAHKSIRWGITGCGLISSWFVTDLTIPRDNAPVKHIIQAVSSSSTQKAEAFVKKSAPSSSPTIYNSYEALFADPNVDVVFIGTPHYVHLQNSIAAIEAGKNVLCEKPLCINAGQAEQIIAAAKSKDVFFMEGLWTRFFPLVAELKRIIHTEKSIGTISRMFCDFSYDAPLPGKTSEPQRNDPSHADGVLLDKGIYPLTWASLVLDQHPDNIGGEPPITTSLMTIENNADSMTSMLLSYPKLHAQAILTSSLRSMTSPEFCLIEGSNGSVSIGGAAASRPDFLIVRLKGMEERRIDFPIHGMGLFYEADAVALDILNGLKESKVLPLSESLRIMKIMDSAREANGLVYPQDLR